MVEPPFVDRAEAGRLLAAELATRKLAANVIVLALPQDGVPVGFEAKTLHAPSPLLWSANPAVRGNSSSLWVQLRVPR
jgi:predicted phosphoribosyltransferase